MTAFDWTRRQFLASAAVSVGVGKDSPSTRSFWVLKLLQPSSINVWPVGTARLHCSSQDGHWIVEGARAISVTPDVSRVRIAGAAGEPVEFALEIPNVIRRRYFGTLDVSSDGCFVIPVVTMDRETATASVVQAELPTSTAPLNALAAQAIISRSVISSATKPRHKFADFCDTTHCQFLRSPAMPGSETLQAVSATKGIVLYQDDCILPALYSAACGGMTNSGTDGDHQYVAVRCEICRLGGIARRGHGFGLCQEGAIGLARLGWSWRAIAAKYYPNTVIGSGLL